MASANAFEQGNEEEGEIETEEAQSLDELGFEENLDDDEEEAETLEAEEETEEEVRDEDPDDDEEEEESLDVLLTRGPVNDDLQFDGDTQVLTRTSGPLAAAEFTCRSCFLVKRQAQLADQERLICLDCV